MAPHTFNAPTGPCKTQNSVVAKPPCPSFATQHFANQADFSCIADQQGLYEALVLTMQCLDCGAANNSLNIKAFFSFADAIIQIETNHREACKCEVEELHCHTKDKDMYMLGPLSACSTKCKANADSDGKPKTKKVKVSPALGDQPVRGSAIRGNPSHHPPPSPLPQEAASGRQARHEGAGGPEVGSEREAERREQ
ncbi:hypothetical protein C0995_007578, partial [Termitomyces sp. Mi166